MPVLTIFTPAYNRAYSIHLCYESLCRQTCKDFIWLVVDDGSSDNTSELIQEWQKEDNGFEIRYIYKENGGMHTAHNTAYENIDTELNVCIDSDDYMTDNAVELIIDCWKKYGSNEYAGIIALDIDSKSNQVIGTELPGNRKSISTTDFYEQGGLGDKKFIYCTDIINSVPEYPVFEGEKYVSLGYKYTLIAQNYEMIILNKPVCVVEYRNDGSSMNMLRQYKKNPKGFAFIRKVHMKYNKSAKRNFIENIHYVSSSIFIKNRKFVQESPMKAMTIASIPFGIALNIYIRIKTRNDK